MAKNTLKWLETEYCGRADETIQPVLVGDTLYYTLFDRHGFNYVFSTIYAVTRHLLGDVNQYEFTCGSEEDLIEYLENK
jgi:hypothetical protein